MIKMNFNKLMTSVTFGLFISTFFIIGWWSVYPYEPTRITEFHLDKTMACRGEIVTFWFTGEKFYDVIPEVAVELVNGETYSLLAYKGTLAKGKLGKTRSFIVPYHVIPNKYQVQWTAIFPINPVRKVSLIKKSDWIEIKDCGFEKGVPGSPGENGKSIKGKQGEPGKNFWGK